MKEFSSEDSEATEFAFALRDEQNFRHGSYRRREIPENLRFLHEIASNYFWSWNTEGIEIFRELDPRLWEKCEQNPLELLKKVTDFRLWQKSLEPDYVEQVRRFAEKLRFNTEKFPPIVRLLTFVLNTVCIAHCRFIQVDWEFWQATI
jgi:hypothetical protein